MDGLTLTQRINKVTYKNLRIGFLWSSKISLMILSLMLVTLWLNHFTNDSDISFLLTAQFTWQMVLSVFGIIYFNRSAEPSNYRFVSAFYSFTYGLSWGATILILGLYAQFTLLSEVLANLTTMVALLGFYTYRNALYLAITPILVLSTWITIKDEHLTLLFSFEKFMITLIIIESGRRVLYRWFSNRIQQEHENKRLLKELNQLASRDQLTQIKNRRFFQIELEKQIKNTQRLNIPLSLILIDIDHFKAFNDSQGHIAGDECLKLVAKVIDASLLRGTDSVSRFGGEEFVVLLPNTNLDGAILVAQRIQENLAKVAIAHPASQTSHVVTISQGITTYEESQRSTQFIEKADHNLYDAKKSGRNCYIAA
ncbi:diguanylate cyclase [Photobacterium angustum]|uniref:GGDEF domain-containing protein n=1 Tax=Photobacterium angustum TaxID=661 RepID=UPI0005DE8EDD|nr:diguanylate cyclase [Photobacterium angustum]KJF94043.1 diguanylate cyclase [Photobacterium angustum]KJG05979.1 diguanylate cyclase [Photobacterium angustum]PSV92524.1 sensor domain-containing diguanylate cyclase [Photobacterium angustum]PSW82599.1 sensor domain-containing diguanylate cyclase [Photobacterium angustum]